MKKVDLTKIKTLAASEILKKVALVRRELTDLVMDKNSNKLKDIRMVFKKRKDLAQMLTILRQKQIIGQLESTSQQVNKSTELTEKPKRVRRIRG